MEEKMDKVFKVLNYLIMVVAGALLLYMIYLVIAAAIATSGTDDITRGPFPQYRSRVGALTAEKRVGPAPEG